VFFFFFNNYLERRIPTALRAETYDGTSKKDIKDNVGKC